MVIPEEREGREDTNLDLARNLEPANATTNSRKAGMSILVIHERLILALSFIKFPALFSLTSLIKVPGFVENVSHYFVFPFLVQ